MRLLLDSHVLLWALYEPEHLSRTAAELIISQENDLFVSVASVWEIANKAAAHRLVLVGTSVEPMLGLCSELDIRILPILPEEIVASAALPRHHNDPFDRMLVAQARLQSLHLVTADSKIGLYDVHTIWR